MDDNFLFSKFFRKRVEPAADASAGRDIVEAATSFILTRTDKELSNLVLQDTAAAIEVDGSLLSKEFELNLKITFEKFVAREKVHRAAFALEKEKDIAIEKLAKRLGYTTIREFELAFEDYFLVEPQMYRELIIKPGYIISTP